VLFIGTWLDRKGAPELVSAWTALAARHPQARLTLAGTGVPAEQVLADFPRSARAQVQAHERVSRQQVADLLATHDIFTLPSWFEGMPLSMLEAASAGLPCVVSAICGNIDVFRSDEPDADGAILIPPHDAPALERALERLISDEALRERLGSRARARSRSFSWGHTAEQLVSAYRAAIGSTAAVRNG
jgi:glycosyltransferase involved in cell wall biosynthesis